MFPSLTDRISPSDQNIRNVICKGITRNYE